MESEARRAVVTGVLGQDGWYLAKKLLVLGYTVIGTSHRQDAAGELDLGAARIPVVRLALSDAGAIDELMKSVRPDEFYNLSARASSAQLFDDPLATTDINGVAVARILESIRKHSPTTRFCQASSSEIFAGSSESPQDEATPIRPRNAYGAAKAFADHLVTSYRSEHGLFAVSAILFPHESPRRSPHFLVRKVTQGAALAEAGRLDRLVLGNLDAVRDWGYAPDYVDAMQRMLQQAEPRDRVLATGEAHTVRDVCAAAFNVVGLDWQQHVEVDSRFQRALEPVARIGNAARARRELGWQPSIDFDHMVARLVDAARAEVRTVAAGG